MGMERVVMIILMNSFRFTNKTGSSSPNPLIQVHATAIEQLLLLEDIAALAISTSLHPFGVLSLPFSFLLCLELRYANIP